MSLYIVQFGTVPHSKASAFELVILALDNFETCPFCKEVLWQNSGLNKCIAIVCCLWFGMFSASWKWNERASTEKIVPQVPLLVLVPRKIAGNKQINCRKQIDSIAQNTTPILKKSNTTILSLFISFNIPCILLTMLAYLGSDAKFTCSVGSSLTFTRHPAPQSMVHVWRSISSWVSAKGSDSPKTFDLSKFTHWDVPPTWMTVASKHFLVITCWKVG